MTDARRVRAEAIRLTKAFALDRDLGGDPEGADAFRDLAKMIRTIPLKQEKEPK